MLKAIDRLRKAGLTRSKIAQGIGATRHAVGRWERNETCPTARNMKGLVELAEQHGITLLASDFVPAEAIDSPTVEAVGQ